MSFEEVVDQAMEMVKRRGRVTYRMLRQHFSLDETSLEDLKEELLFSHPQITDESGRGLVWAEHTEAPLETASHTSSSTSQSVSQDEPLAPVGPLVDVVTPMAERRQLTVMFCDLVGSTQLSGQLDPEELREIIRAYQEVAVHVIQRFDGYIAQYLGDGLLVYFGFPLAHEDDARRAIHTGLGIVEAMEELNARLGVDNPIQLDVRIAIHTGPVVVGEMGSGGRYEQLALGETPNIAARLEGLAPPNTVVISEATKRLVQGYFVYGDVEVHTLAGVTEPVQLYQVLQESGAQNRLETMALKGLTPLIGRESEAALMRDRWDQVKAGMGQVLAIIGEAGLGKSRLAEVLQSQLDEEPYAHFECQASPYYQNTALYPVVDVLQSRLGIQPHDAPEQKLTHLKQALGQSRLDLAEAVPLLASFLSVPLPADAYPALSLSSQQQRQKTLEILVSLVVELAEHQPVLFILEDLHWVDPTTLDLLSLMMDQIPAASIFLILTYRPEFQSPWSHRSYLMTVTLNRLTRPQVEEMVEQITFGKSLPAAVLHQLVEKSDGVPLYVEELTKAVLESDQLTVMDDQSEFTGPLTALSIPSTLQDSLMARLDRLGEAKTVAQWGATLGRQFSHVLLKAVVPLDELALWRALVQLIQAEIIYQRGTALQATYVFKHALIQHTAYESLLRSTRQGYHQRIAKVLEEQWTETADTQPELLAHHYTEAHLIEPAVRYWLQAGQHARARSAQREAAGHATKGLEVLSLMPESPVRHEQELKLLLVLGVSQVAIAGYASMEVDQTYTRARELCRNLDDPEQVFPVLHGLRNFYLVRAELSNALELADDLLEIAHRHQAPELLLHAHMLQGHTRIHLGQLTQARAHFEDALCIYAPYDHVPPRDFSGLDPRMVTRAWLAHALSMLGYLDQAKRWSEESIALAYELENPFNLMNALIERANFLRRRQELNQADEAQEIIQEIATEHGFPQQEASGLMRQGIQLMREGQLEAGQTLVERGQMARSAAGAMVRLPLLSLPVVEVYRDSGQIDSGLSVVSEALDHSDRTGERWCDAELYRLRGELLLVESMSNSDEAKSCFLNALTIAQDQQAKLWELRAGMSLSRLLQQQEAREEARELLLPIYDWFTEGFDTADLQEAKSLLAELDG